MDQQGLFETTGFNFLSVYQGVEVNTVESDGLVGLSVAKIGNRNQDLLVSKLYDQKKIGIRGFSLFIGNLREQSKIWIGAFVVPKPN